MFGKAKLAPQPEVTIPRLELCAAVLAVEITDMLVEETDVQFDSVRFFTDSKVVLGYICNESRRFYVYVSNRVQRIRKSSLPEQWNYFPTDTNPADHASQSIPANTLVSSMWLKGPDFLLKPDKNGADSEASFDLLNPQSDPEICPLVTSFSTLVAEPPLNPRCFESFWSWRSLVRTISRLIHIVRSFKQENSQSDCRGWHRCENLCPEDLVQAKSVIIRRLQYEAFPEVFACIQAGKEIPKQSQLRRLCPYMDDASCLRVGGRLSQADLESDERNPLIIPRRHHLTTLLIRHYQQQVKHQGRHFTGGAVRSAGLWVVGGKQCISAIIHSCVTCRKLRWRTETQKMADLPTDRLHMGGSWEQMIGLTRCILDSMLMGIAPRQLTHEVLTTFSAEVTAIVNSQPLIPVSTDPSFPLILTPATLLTQKVGVPSIPPGNFDESDLFRRQWRQVKHLSNVFWYHWKSQYLSTLQRKGKEMALREAESARRGPCAVEGQSSQEEPLAHGRGSQNPLES